MSPDDIEQEISLLRPVDPDAEDEIHQDRLDIVTLESRSTEEIFVVFHEAKHFSNPVCCTRMCRACRINA
jgi:hypothetical protein